MAGAGYVTSVEGILKLVTILFGAVAFGCGAPAYDKFLKFEEFFFGAVLACFVASTAFYPVFSMASSLDNNRSIRFLDFFYHVVLGIILVIASGMMLSSAVKHHKNDAPDGWDIVDSNYTNFSKKVAAGSFALINGVIYFVTSFIIISRRNDDELSFSRNYPKGG